jgi:hypothetical protein
MAVAAACRLQRHHLLIPVGAKDLFGYCCVVGQYNAPFPLGSDTNHQDWLDTHVPQQPPPFVDIGISVYLRLINLKGE